MSTPATWQSVARRYYQSAKAQDDKLREVDAYCTRAVGYLERILDANKCFRESLPDDWESDPLNDVCIEADKFIADAGLKKYSHPLNWQPITTAPKDGTVILLFVPDDDDGEVIWPAHWSITRPYSAPDEGGWRHVSGGRWAAQNTEQWWMPLPPPPERGL